MKKKHGEKVKVKLSEFFLSMKLQKQITLLLLLFGVAWLKTCFSWLVKNRVSHQKKYNLIY